MLLPGQRVRDQRERPGFDGWRWRGRCVRCDRRSGDIEDLFQSEDASGRLLPSTGYPTFVLKIERLEDWKIGRLKQLL